MRNYYIVKNGESAGPYTIDQLKFQGINSETKVWYEGLPEWVIAGSLPELSELFQVAPILPPTAAAHKKDWQLILLRVLAVATFIVMIAVAYWRFGAKSPMINPKPDPKPDHKEIHTKKDSIVVYPVDPVDPVDAVDPRVEYLREHWPELVKVSIVDAKWDAFGGVSDVYVVATNSMEYKVEWFMFEAKYILENGKIWKTREFTIENIPANGLQSKPLQIEGSHRGKSIEFESINIVCKGIGIDEALLR